MAGVDCVMDLNVGLPFGRDSIDEIIAEQDGGEHQLRFVEQLFCLLRPLIAMLLTYAQVCTPCAGQCGFRAGKECRKRGAALPKPQKFACGRDFEVGCEEDA